MCTLHDSLQEQARGGYVVKKMNMDPNTVAVSSAGYGPGVSDVNVTDQKQFPGTSGRLLRGAIAVLALGGGAYCAFSLAGPGVQAWLTPWLLLLAFAGGLLSTWSPCGYSSLSLLRPWGGHDDKQVVNWLPTFFAHGVGYAISGAVLAGLLGLAGTMLFSAGFSGWPLLMIGLLAIGYGLHCLGLIPMPYPQRKAQVPHKARNDMPMWRVGLLYGLILGTNFMTYVRTPVVYIVVGLAVISGSWLSAALLIAALNLGRWLPLIVNAAPLPDATVQRWLAANEERAVLFDGALLTVAGAAFVVLGLA